MPPVLGYWKIRGLAQPIRLLLHYVGQDYEDRMYEQGNAPDYSREEWLKVKHTLGLPFPNLPFYIDGDLKITESNAILYYLGRKHGLVGTTEEERVANDMFMSMQMDLRQGLVRIAYNADFENLKEEYVKNAPAKVQALSAYLGSKHWLSGENLATSDFCMYELLTLHKILEPSLLDSYPNLVQYCERFEALPKIKEYMESPSFLSRPLNNKIAKWGGHA